MTTLTELLAAVRRDDAEAVRGAVNADLIRQQSLDAEHEFHR